MAVAENEVYFEKDMPYLKVKLHGPAHLECCYAATSGELEPHWLKQTKPMKNLTSVEPSERISFGNKNTPGKFCGTVSFKYVHLNDTAMYHCYMTKNRTHRSHGTYMQVYSKCWCVWAVGGREVMGHLIAMQISLIYKQGLFV